MCLFNKILSFVVICLWLCFSSSAQTDDANYMGHNIVSEGLGDTEEETDQEDTESIVVEVESIENQNSVDEIVTQKEVIKHMIDADSNLSSWGMYSNNENLIPYIPDIQQDIYLTKRYDVIPVNEEYTYIKGYIFNKNQAWDYIYERIYNKEGSLIFFARYYNTYNSGCSEVAFEESEYFFDNEGELIKKTYNIYDNRNNLLDMGNCYMDRESYDKYFSLKDFLSVVPLPIDQQ